MTCANTNGIAANPKHFKVFRYSEELQSAGYQPVAGSAYPIGRWELYAKTHLIPPDPEETADEPWYGYLDNVDEDSRRRRQRAQVPSPAGTSRDEIAAWVAKKHLFVDSGIQKVWYLPHEAPPEEIRLLELNDRIASAGSKVEAIDFGLDVEGAHFKLLVADISSEQLDQIKQDSSRLPAGWALDGSRIWERGA
jgi:hypothetical protein